MPDSGPDVRRTTIEPIKLTMVNTISASFEETSNVLGDSVQMSDEPGPSTQDPKTRPKRGAATFRPPNRSIPELINNPANNSTIIDEATARAELERRFFITPATEITIESLTTALLDFTVQANSLTPMHIDIIRAIAILLVKTDHAKKTKLLADAMIERLMEPLMKLEEIATKHESKMEILTRVTDEPQRDL
ncbi:hypothetical protein C8R48DRAFT_672790 [Suillus tomentosus]|nr:hypothetical protein C8R48DRAFT_672790 [Suillus tomentosus]